MTHKTQNINIHFMISDFTQHNTIDTAPKKQPEPSIPHIDETIAPRTKQVSLITKFKKELIQFNIQ